MSAPFLNEDNSSEVVAQRLLAANDGRLPQFLVSLVSHLHQAVKEARPTPADWRQAIAFLTDVGHASDDKRQEWILLSDLLGVTALVEEINSRRPRGATPNTARGPFYRPDAPRYEAGASISLDGVGEPLAVSGTVRDLDGLPIAGAIVETWQANSEGLYENQQPDGQPDFNLRGSFATGRDGRFRYATIKPSGYGVPGDGPVGELLGRIGYPLLRPAHIGFVVSADGFETITTHVYERDDPNLYLDAVFGVRPELVADVRRDGRRAWTLEFDFVMVRTRKGRRAA